MERGGILLFCLISRCGDIHWPPRSPDLTSIYKIYPQEMAAIMEITYHAVLENFVSRLKEHAGSHLNEIIF